METARIVVPEAEEILGKYFPVLDHGFVALVDYMGGDLAIERAARCSYTIGPEVRDIKEMRHLLRYLFRHRHCYRGDMQVLTARGWLRWDECEGTETFLVPDPITRRLIKETLVVEKFDCDEPLITMENQRMSFAVTGDHRMYFRTKHSKEFRIEKASQMPHWGHFDPLPGYQYIDIDGGVDPNYAMIGFILGDGCWAPSGRRVFFHLKKRRKIEYLRRLADRLGWESVLAERASTSRPGAICFTISLPDDWNPLGLIRSGTARTKSFDLKLIDRFSGDEIRGLFDGLVNSDGSLKKDRPQLQYSSCSLDLIQLFETLSAYLGFDAHMRHTPEYHCYMTTAHRPSRTSLEARAQYFGVKHHHGFVFCATTSTGFLMVRGAPDKFGFVCGNSSPFEQTEIAVHMAMPIFSARQFVRHRTANLNEYSGRYSLMPMLFYTPPDEDICYQADSNKQGRSGAVEADVARQFVRGLEEGRDRDREFYRWAIEQGLAKELARIDLPLSIYTYWYWKCDVRNLVHLIGLRSDPHAQKEIRVYSDVLAGIVKRVCPLTLDAFQDYQMDAVTMTQADLAAVRFLCSISHPSPVIWDSPPASVKEDVERYLAEEWGIRGREAGEFWGKIRTRAKRDFSLDAGGAMPASHFLDAVKKHTIEVST